MILFHCQLSELYLILLTTKWYVSATRTFFSLLKNLSSLISLFFKEQENWEQWDENPVVVVSNKPCNSVQSKIEQYRQQIAKVPEQNEETQVDFFQVNN